MKNRQPKGVTLLELVIAVAMISAGMVIISLTFPKATAALASSRSRVIATNFAAARMQELKNLPYPLLPVTAATAANFPVSLVAITTPPTAGKCDCSQENLSSAQYQETASSFAESGTTYMRHVCINLVTRNTAGTGWTSYCPNGQIGGTDGADQGLKSIRVRVTWTNGTKTNYLDMESMSMR